MWSKSSSKDIGAVMTEETMESNEIHYARLPRKGEVLGIVTELKGGARMVVQCADGKERLCRVPGRIKRAVWVKEGDYVIVEPWAVEGESKGDVVYRYTHIQIDNLKRKGLIKTEL